MTTHNFHSPYGYNLVLDYQPISILILWVLPLSYSYATRKSYTRISPLHGKEDCWHFRGVYELPHSHLTRIQRQLLIVASITPPTHMLPLIAIVNAPHLEFGGSPLYTASVALTAQQLSTSILVSLLWLFRPVSQHTGFVHLHWVLIIRIDLVEISTAARRRLSWCHKKWCLRFLGAGAAHPSLSPLTSRFKVS